MEENQELLGQSTPRFRFTYWDLCAGLVPLMTLLPLLIGHFTDLRGSPVTNLAPLGWLLLAAVVFWKGKGAVCVQETRMIFAVLMLLLGMILHALAILHWSFNLTHWAFATFLVAWGLGRFRDTSWSQVVAWGGVLALMSTPLDFVTQVDTWIYESASALASRTLDYYRIPHLLEHGRFLLREGEFVARAVISLRLGIAMAVWTIALWCCLLSRSFTHSLLLLIGAPVALWLLRFGLILLIAYGIQYQGQDWSTGPEHVWITLGAGMLGFLLLVCGDQFLRAMLGPVPVTDPTTLPVFAAVNELISWPRDTSDTQIVSGDPLEVDEHHNDTVPLPVPTPTHQRTIDWKHHSPLKNTVLAVVISMFLLGAISSLATYRSGLSVIEQTVAELELSSLKADFTEDLLPAEIGKFTRTKFQFAEKEGVSNDAHKQSAEAGSSGAKDKSNQASELDVQWTYRWEDMQVAVQVTAPHAQWQAPFDTSQQSVRQKVSQELVDLRTGQRNWPWYRCRIIGMYGEFSYFYQCAMKDDLEDVSPDEEPDIDDWQIRRQLRMTGTEVPIPSVYFINVHCDSGIPLAENQSQELESFFYVVRESLRRGLKPDLLSAPVTQDFEQDARQETAYDDIAGLVRGHWAERSNGETNNQWSQASIVVR